MGKSKHFNGQPVLNQMLKFIDKGEIRKITSIKEAE
jgi:hypothetical protein